MRAWVLLVVFTASEIPVYAAPRVTLQQVEQYLAREQAAHASDGAVAQKLLLVNLAQRLNASTLRQIEAKYHPGNQTVAALSLLADLSAFLSPTDGELVCKAPPSAATQRQILRAAANFATVTMKHLPDFLATRTTRRFEDIPILRERDSFQTGLHAMGATVGETAYRNGREVAENADTTTRAHMVGQRPPQFALTSTGEFGPVLATVVNDSARGATAWSHWEQSSAGLLAVFHYEVPKQASHYEIYFCCGWKSGAHGPSSYHGSPAYHGSLWINPSTGAIMRVTLVAEFAGFDPPPNYSLLVRYAKVVIGGISSILPVRSVVIGEGFTKSEKRFWTSRYIDEVSFTHYRRFGSTVRILSKWQNP